MGPDIRRPTNRLSNRLRRRLLHILHFGHSGITKMTSEAKIFWWPDLKQDIDNKVKYCTAYPVSSKCLKYQLQPKKVNRAPRVRRSTVHMGLKITLFELHHGRKPRTELTHIVKNGKTYLSIWSELNISAPNRPKIPNYVGRDAEGDVTNHIIMERTRTEGKHLNEGPNSPKKKTSVSYLFYFVEKNYSKNH